jgi:hypothetical protein
MLFKWLFQISKNLHFETQLLEIMDWNQENAESFVEDIEKEIALHEHKDQNVFYESIISKGRKYVPDHNFEEFEKLMKETISHILVDILEKSKELESLEN